MTLYDIRAEYLRLLDDIANEVIPEEAINDTLDGVEAELVDKIDNVACYVKGITAEAEAIKTEIAALQKRQKAKQREADRLIDYIYTTMSETGQRKIETPRNKLTIKQNPEAVTITNDAAFIEWAQEHNDELLTYTTPRINKTKIKQAIKAGETVPMCSITREERLEIK